jgi:hypothetical protein
VIRRLYEWEVRAGSRHRLTSCGVTDAPLRARLHMLNALSTAPASEVARGSVTVIEMATGCDHYDYFQPLFAAERDPQGMVRWQIPYLAPRLLAYTDATGRLCTAIDLRRVAP